MLEKQDCHEYFIPRKHIIWRGVWQYVKRCVKLGLHPLRGKSNVGDHKGLHTIPQMAFLRPYGN